MAFYSWRKWLNTLSGATKVAPARSAQKARKLDVEYLETRLAPAVQTWSGAGTDNLWRDAANWAKKVAPSPGDDLLFPKGASQLLNTNDFAPGTAFNSITFSGGGYSLSGNPIVLGRTTGGSVADNSGAITNKLNMNLIFLGTKGTETFSASSNTVLTVTGQIAGPSSFQMKITNLGTVVLTADNSGFTGPVTVNQGALQIQNANSLGSLNATTVQSGATLQLKDVVGVVPETIVASGPGVNGNGAIENVHGINAISGNIAFGANLVIGADDSSQLTLSGTLSDNNIGYTLTKVGAGRLVLTHANTYLGATNIENGIVNIQDPNALGKTTNSATVQFSPSSPTIPAKIGTLELQLGDLSVVGKRLTLNGPGADGGGALRNVSGNNTWDGDITLGNSASIGVDGASSLNIGGPSDTLGIIRQGGQISTMTKEGTGRLILNRADSYTGPTIIDQGVITANNPKAFNIAALTGGVIVVGRAALELEVSVSGVPLTLNGPGINNSGALLNVSGINAWTGDVSLPTDASVGAVQGTQLTIGDIVTGRGIVSGRGGLTKYGLGEVVLPNADTYLGTTEVVQGTLTAENNTALGGIPPGLSVLDQAGTIVDSGAALHLKGVKQNGQGSLFITEPLTLAGTGVNGTGAVDNIDGVNTITGDVLLTGSTSLGVEAGAGTLGGVVNPSELTMSGNFSDSTGPFGIKKVGPNRLIVSGFNLYGGVTEVAQGTLTVGGSNSVGKTDGTAATGTVVDLNAALEMKGGIQVLNEALTLNGPGVSNTGALRNVADDNRWSGNVTLIGNSFVGVDVNSRLTMRGNVDDGLNGFSITKAGGGKLVLGGNNTYAGGTHILAGIVNVQNSSALGLSTGGTVVENGGSVETQVGVSITDQKLVGNGTGPGLAETVPLQWFPIGPAPILNEPGSNSLFGVAKPGLATGRIAALAADPNNAKVYYVAAAGGGVWKTKDGGISWVPLTDNVPGAPFQSMFMGAIAIAPSNTNTIYAGTGEPNFSGDSFYGRGVLWSPNGGLTWKLLGDDVFDRLAISKIVVSPQDPNMIWVATENFAANGVFNANNGVWRGIIDPASGTATFEQVINANDISPELLDTDDNFYQFTDLAIDPIPDNLNNFHLYVGVGIPGTGLNDAGLYESLNNGDRFTWVKTNFPSGGGVGTIKMTLQHSDPSQLTVLYAVVTNATGGLREIDQGLDLDLSGFIATFAKTAKTPADYLTPQGDYDSAIAVDPNDPNHVVVAGDTGATTGVFETFDGGTAGWVDIGLGVDNIAPHTDYHSLVFDANGKVLAGNDGGIWRLANPTIPIQPPTNPPFPAYNIHWTNLNANLQITQFTGFAINPSNPNIAYGGTQDNGTLKYSGGLGWNNILNGDGGFSRMAVDPFKPDTVYAERFGISINRSDDAGKSFQPKVKGINLLDLSAFYVPYVMDPTILANPVDGSPVGSHRLLLGTDHLYETTNRGDQWTAIASPNSNGFDVKQFAVITAIAVPNNNPDIIYMSSGGDIFVTVDHGKHWTKRDILVPDGLGNTIKIDDSINELQVDPANQNILYAVRGVFNETGAPNRFGHVFRTLDGGLHWTDITGNLPDLPTYTLAVDPRPNPHVLYIGNDNGVWFNTNLGTSDNGLGQWQQLGVGMPNTQVVQLALDPLHDYLAAATHGRGVFEVELDPALANAGAMRAVTGASTWSGPITLSNTTTVGADAGSALTLSGNITDNLLGAGLVKNGPGTVSLTNTNTYGGKTIVNAGTLDVQSSQSLGTNTEAVVNSGGTLKLDGDGILYTKHLTIAGLGADLAGALDNGGGSNTWAGNITLSNNASVGADSFTQLTIGDPSAPAQGVIGDGGKAFGLFKQGGGTVVLTHADTYSGDTTIDAGTLNIQNTSALGSGRGTTHVQAGGALELQFDPNLPGPNVISGESLDLNGGGVFDPGFASFRGALRNVSGNNVWLGTVNLLTPAFIGADNDGGGGTANGNPLTLAGAVGDKSSKSSLTKVGDGMLVLANNNNYRGGTVVLSGILDAEANQAFGTNDVGTTVVNGAAIEVQQPLGSPALIINQVLHLNGTGINSGGALDNIVGNNTWSGPITFDTSSSVSVENDDLGTPLQFTITGNISGLETSVVNKVGPGTLFFPNSNDYQGQTLVNSGILLIANGASLGAGSGDGTFVTDGATLQIELDKNNSPITVVGKTLQLTGTGVGGKGALQNLTGNNVWNGPIILNGDASVVIDQPGDILTSASSISESVGGSSLIVNGPGTFSMTGGVTFDNSYSGTTFVNSGTLLLGKAPGVLAVPGDLVIGTGQGAPMSAVVRLMQDGQFSASTTNITVNVDGCLDLNGHATQFASLNLNGGCFETGAGNNVTINGNVNVTATTLEIGPNSTLTINGNLNLLSGFVKLDDPLTSKLIVNGKILGKSDGTSFIGGGGIYLNGKSLVIQPIRGSQPIDLEIDAPIIGSANETVTVAAPDPADGQPGILDLTAVERYNGGTFVTGATLLADGTLGNVSVTGGTLGGAGKVGNIVAQGGTVSPGTPLSTSATLSASNASFATGSTYNVQINSATSYSVLNVTGAVNLDVDGGLGSALTGGLSGGYKPAVGTVFTIIQAAGGLSNTFRSLPANSTVIIGGLPFTVGYTANTVTLKRAQAGSSTQVTVSPTAPVFGQGVVFTATVAPQAPATAIPTGTVTFTVDSTTYGPISLDPTGSASTPAITNLGVGPHTYAAAYSGGADFASSNSGAPQTVTVSKANSTVGASDSPISPVFGQQVTFTASVAAQLPGAGTPSGTVTFTIDGTSVATKTLDPSAKATFSTSTLSVGGHKLVVSYGGDGNFNNAVSSTFNFSVAQSAANVATVSSSQNPSVFGQAVTFSTIVSSASPGLGTPTGTVNFFDGTTQIGQASLANVSGQQQASITFSGLAVGNNHAITAAYLGDANFGSNTSSALTQVVNQDASIVTLKASANPSVFGQSVTFTATIAAAAPGAGAPTGSVNFFDGGTQIGSGNISTVAGQQVATFTDAALSVSPPDHAITAVYGGDGNFTGNTSANLPETVNKDGSAVTVAVAPTTPVFGQSVTFTATVAAKAPGGGTPGGTVVFTVGATSSAAIGLDANGKATFSLGGLTIGAHSVSVAYSGDGNFLSGNSATSNFSVAQAATAVATVSGNPAAIVFSQSVTFATVVTVTSPGAGTPTGSVTFFANNVSLGAGTLDASAHASLTTSTVPGGTQLITATYSGDTNFAGSTTVNAFTETVTPANATVTAVTATKTTTVFGESVVFSTTVTPAAPATGATSGVVNFLDNGTVFGSATLSGSTASFTETTQLSAGNHSITVAYLGDGNFNANSNTTALSYAVTQDATTTSVASSANPSVFSQPVTFTATVAANAPGSGTPTGQVTFSIDGSAQARLPLTAGKATYTTSALTGGAHVVAVSYSGDGNFSVSDNTVKPLSQSVTAANATINLSVSANPSVFGQPVALSATVGAASPATGVPTGTVTFFLDGKSQSTVPVDISGHASFTLTSLATIGHSVSATYNGDNNFSSIAGIAFGITVNPALVTVGAVAANPTSSVFGQAVLFSTTVAVVAPGAGSPTGSVTFLDNGVPLGAGNLSGGAASFTFTGTLATGSNHNITASYSGDTNFVGNTSTGVSFTVNKAGTTTATVSSSASAFSVFGQAVTFTTTVAAVAPGAGTPTGTVTFLDGATQLGTAQLAGGTASFTTTSSLSVTTHNITASYGGDVNFVTSAAANPFVQTVHKADTATGTVAVTPSSSVYGQAVTFTVALGIVSPGAGTLTGTVTFLDNGNSVGTGIVSGSAATFTTTTALAAADHPITAMYNGDGNFGASTSASAAHEIVSKASTTVGLTASSSTAVFGQAIVLTASVGVKSPGAGTPGGSVTFNVDGKLNTVNLSNTGTATLTQALATGAHTASVVYNGDANFATSSSTGSLPLTVNPASTTTGVSSSNTSTVFGQPFTLTATVSANAPGAGTPTGMVTFLDSGASIGTAPLSGGAATLTVSSLIVGGHPLTAKYGGDSNFQISASSPSVLQTVLTAATTTTVSASTNLVIAGRPVTFKATVSAQAPGAGNPQGTVNFLDGATLLGSAPLSGNTATLQTSFPAGSHTVTAAYINSDGQFSGSTTVTPAFVSVGTLNQSFVGQVYLDLLNRTVDPNGLAGWTNALDHGASRAAVVRGIEASLEYRQIEVNNLYNEFLHRPGDAVGVLGYANALATATVEQVASTLVASPEYLNNPRVHNDNNLWLAAIAQDALGVAHSFTPQEQSILLLLLQNFTPRDRVALLAFRSNEAETSLVSSYYPLFLRRAADQGGVAGYVNSVINQNARQEDVISQIMGSDEYFSRL